MKRFLPLLALLLCAQTPVLPGFPPGVFNSRGAIDATPASGFTGPGDVVSGAKVYYGGQAYNAAYASGSGKAFNVCLAGDTTCADLLFGSDGNVVDSAVGGSNCSSVTCTIKTIYDQSGALNCSGSTACDLTQSVEANRAQVTFASGKAYMDCPGGACGYPFVTITMTAIAQPFTESIVFNYTSQAAQAALIYGAPNSELLTERSAGTNIGYYDGVSVITVATTGATFYALQNVVDGASSDMYLNGSSNAQALGTNGISTALQIFAAGAGDKYKGKIAQFGIWASAFDATQKSNMNSNQHTFWGF